MGVSFRRTRIVWLTVIAVAVFLLVGYRQGTIFSLPTSFSLSRNGESVLANTVIPRVKPQEIHGLLHLVAQSSGQLATDGSIDAAASLPLSAYAAAAGSGGNWDAHVELLLRNAPVVVFSKSYCPYSKRGKALLESYKLVPEPVIVELDQRADGQVIQQVLGRLTGRRTVPNVLLRGKTIGGSDDIYALHNSDKLRSIFEDAGIVVTGNV